MKKIFVFILALSLLVVPASFAADKVTKNVEKAIKGEGVDWAPQKNIITVNPLIFLGILNAHYETALSKENGLGFNGNLWFATIGDWSYFTVGAGAEYNWYFQKHALNGWFAGPHASFQMANVSYKYTTYDSSSNLVEKNESATGIYIGIGGHGGYRWIWDSGFTLDLQASLTYSIGSSITIGGATASGIGGIGFGPGVNVGYAW